MSSTLDMALDDIINTNQNLGNASFRSRGRGRGRSSGPGPARRHPNRGFNRSAPYATARVIQAPETAWQHDMFVAQPSAIDTGTKLYVSNLDYGVSNEDVKELFSEVGDVKRYGIHYDSSGRSKGTAEVVFFRRTDALSAVKRYNNVQLDGKPMKIEIVGSNISTPAVPLVNGNFGNLNGPYGRGRGGPGRGAAFSFSRPRGGGRGFARGPGFGRGRGRRSGGRGGGKISADDLDAELEKYHSAAMKES
ncbi:THO complex subunit 4A [Linum perenne]